MLGTRQPRYYVQGSANYSDRNYWVSRATTLPAAQVIAAETADASVPTHRIRDTT